MHDESAPLTALSPGVVQKVHLDTPVSAPDTARRMREVHLSRADVDIAVSDDARPAAAAPTREALARMRHVGQLVQVQARADADADAEAPAATPVSLSREQILNATEACLREAGYDGATIRRIAGRLGCAVGSIYRYFRDKRKLLLAVTHRRFEAVLEMVEAGEPIEATARAYWQTAVEQPQQYRLMFWLAGSDQRGPAEAPQAVQQLIAGWTRQLGDGDDARRRWAQLHGHIMLGLPLDEAIVNLDAPPAATRPADEPASPAARDDLTLL